MEQGHFPAALQQHRQLWLLLGLVVATLILILFLSPIPQDPEYHRFADARRYFDIPNFFNVISNIFFLFVGMAGVRFSLRTELGRAQRAWLVFFAGVTLVSAGSTYYHWHPENTTLIWDRIPMTMAFMALFVALLSEHIDMAILPRLLLPAVLLGLASVAYWAWQDDLRFYAWVQFFPLLVLPLVMWLFRSRYTHQQMMLLALFWYVLAKVLELADKPIFDLLHGLISGHALKHIAAAIGCLMILRMLQHRTLRIN